MKSVSSLQEGSKYGFPVLRQAIVEGQIRLNKVTDPLLLRAFKDIPRENFVPEAMQDLAYGDEVIYCPSGRFMLPPMELGQLIASLALKPQDKVLAIGCTTGYSLALLKGLAESLFGLESDTDLAYQALDILKQLHKTPKALLNASLAEGI